MLHLLPNLIKIIRQLKFQELKIKRLQRAPSKLGLLLKRLINLVNLLLTPRKRVNTLKRGS